MYIGTIRPVELRTASVEGAGLEEVAEKVAELTPENWQATETKVSMSKHESTLRAEATFARRDGAQEIQGTDLTELRAAVPEGFQLLYVRSE